MRSSSLAVDSVASVPVRNGTPLTNGQFSVPGIMQVEITKSCVAESAGTSAILHWVMS